MKKLDTYILFFIFLFAPTFSWSRELVRLKDQTEATIELKTGCVHIEFRNSANSWEQDIIYDSEKPIELKIEDLNSDGNSDFSISHVDEGMGTYYIHRVFLYSTKKRIFLEVFPTCTNEFINLKKKNGYLVSSYISNGRWRQCKTFPPKIVQ